MTDLSRRMEQERGLLLARWDGPSMTWPDERFVDALLSAQAAATPDAIALVYNDVYLSYAQQCNPHTWPTSSTPPVPPALPKGP
jgi:non-ribosomal peptide synthetase component F